MEIQQSDPRTNPVRGAGATPSMGLSQFRGGMTYHGGADSESDEELVGGNLGMERRVGAGRSCSGGNKEHYKTAVEFMKARKEQNGTFPSKSETVAHLRDRHGLSVANARKVEEMADDYLHPATKTKEAAEGLLTLGREGRGKARRKGMNEATEMGLHLGKHLHTLHGAGWWDDFKSGFNMVMDPVAKVAKGVLPMLGPEGAAASGVIGALGYGRHRGCGTGAGKLTITHGGRRRRQQHPEDIHGAGWWDDFKSGFNMVMDPVAKVAKGVLPMLGPEGMAASGVIGALGYGRRGRRGGAMYPSGAYEGQGRERDDVAMMGMGRKKRAPAGPQDGRRKRAEIVRKVMADKGMKMIEASKYVKAHGLY